MVTLFLSGHTFQIFVVGNSHQSAAVFLFTFLEGEKQKF